MKPIKHNIYRYLQQASIPIAFATIGLSASNALASSEIHVDRYLKTAEHPSVGQADLLAQRVYIRFSARIRTVGDAMRQLLNPTGYRLVDSYLPDSARYMLQRSLPKIHQELGPLSLQEALITLSGNTFTLLVDPVHRLVSFELKNIYSGHYQLNSIQE